MLYSQFEEKSGLMKTKDKVQGMSPEDFRKKSFQEPELSSS